MYLEKKKSFSLIRNLWVVLYHFKFVFHQALKFIKLFPSKQKMSCDGLPWCAVELIKVRTKSTDFILRIASSEICVVCS